MITSKVLFFPLETNSFGERVNGVRFMSIEERSQGGRKIPPSLMEWVRVSLRKEWGA